jgi:hypothetical protein
MTLEDKIRLIDELIEEYPDVTIREYVDALKEITDIEEKTEEAVLKKRLQDDRKEAFQNRTIIRGCFGRFARQPYHNQKASS